MFFSRNVLKTWQGTKKGSVKFCEVETLQTKTDYNVIKLEIKMKQSPFISKLIKTTYLSKGYICITYAAFI